MRVARKFIPTIVYHLIWRFVGQTFFINTPEDRACYLRLLGRALVDTDWRCLSFAIMSNHIHLAMVAGLASLTSWAVRAHTPFAQYINSRDKRIGPVFVRGPKAHAIRPEKEGKLIAYIHNNPVRAAVVPFAADSSWSSHRAYLGLEPVPSWLHVDEGLAKAGFEDVAEFDQWINETPGESGKVRVGRVRREARKRGAIEVATPTGGDVKLIPLVARPSAHVRPDPKLLVRVTAELLGISEVRLCSRGRTPDVVAGRRVVVSVGRTLGIGGADIAASLAISQAAVSQIALTAFDETLAPLRRIVLERMQYALDLDLVR